MRPERELEGRRYEFIDGMDAYRDTVLGLEYRKRMCEQILKHALAAGLDTDVKFVNRYYEWFLRWHEGAVATGYLMRRTGVRRKPRT